MKRLNQWLLGAALIAGLVGYCSKPANALVSNQTVQTVTGLGNGVTTNYTISFDFRDNTQVVVTQIDSSTTPPTATVIAQGAGASKFTVTGGNPGTTVVMGTAPSATQYEVISRSIPITQTTHFDPAAAFPTTNTELTLDQHTLLVQNLNAAVGQKVGLNPYSTASPTPTLPDPIADNLLLYDHTPRNMTVWPGGSLASGDFPYWNGSSWAKGAWSSAGIAAMLNAGGGILAGSGGGTGVNNGGTLTWGSNNLTFTLTGTTNLIVPAGTVNLSANPMTTSGDMIYGGAAGVETRLAGDTSNTRKFFRELSIAGVAQPPAWDILAAGDVPTLNQNTTGSAANVTVTVANSGTGTGANLLALITGGQAQTIGTGTTSGIVGVVAAGAGAAGNATITQAGNVSCVFDGATTAGNFVQASTTVAGQCHDAGATNPTNGKQVLGQVFTTNGGGGTYSMNIATGGGGGGIALPLTATNGGTGISTAASTGVPTVNAGTWTVPSKLAETLGGTNQSTYTTGDLLYASGTNTLSKLGLGGDGKYIAQQGGLPTYINPRGVGFQYLIGSDSDFETSIGNWSAYADAAGTKPVDATGGSPTTTCTRATSSPLRGLGNLLITKDAANRQGEGCKVDYTIDSADLAKPLLISFDYTVGSGTYADGDLTVWDYDGTNVTQLAPYQILSVTAGVSQKWIGYYQTASTGTSHRLAFHVASTSASAYTVKVDNITVSPTYQSYGAVQTDFVAWTPTGGWSGGNVTYTGKKRRNGQFGEYEVNVALIGAPTGTTLYFNMPSGEVIDTAAYPVTPVSGYMILDSSGAVIDSGVKQYPSGATYKDTTSVYPNVSDASGAYLFGATPSATVPITFGSGDSVTIRWRVPIVGWSSNVQVSSDADTRVVAFAANTATATVTGSASDVSWTKVQDTHGGFNGTTSYTIPVPGWYDISAEVRQAATYAAGNYVELYILVDGTSVRTGLDRASGAQVNMSVNAHLIKYLNAGQVIKVQTDSNATSPTMVANAEFHYFSIFRLAGPAQIAASEKVRVKYQNTAGTSITSTITTVPYATKIYDSHSAFNGATGVFTAPRADYYRLQVRGRLQSVNNSTAQVVEVEAIVTSTPESLSAGVQQLDARFGNGAAHVQNFGGGGTWWLNQGDTIAVQVANTNTIGLDTTVGYNVIQIESQGGI